MRRCMQQYILLFCVLLSEQNLVAQSPALPGVFLEDINWIKAKEILTPQTVVVIPLGAQAKEHGPHLPLSTDFIQSQYFARAIARTENVVMAPQLNYGFYFPFITFPGSTSLRYSVAKGMVLDVCRSLAAFGPKRFYIINEGVATNAVLKPAADLLAAEGILLMFTDLTGSKVDSLLKSIQQQKEGSHADEIETSKLLYMQPSRVNMKFAKREYGVKKGKGFPTFDSTQNGHYLPSGIYGDATLASTAKGKKITEGMLAIMKEDINRLRQTPLPAAVPVNLTRYTGTYKTDDGKRMSITDSAGLVCEEDNLPKEKLHYNGEDYFSGFYYELWFHTNDAGNIIALNFVDITGKVQYAKKQNE